MENVLRRFIASLKIPVSKDYVNQLLLSHPEYPSLLSIADTLEKLGIKFRVARIEKEFIQDVQFPFIAHLNRSAGEIILIRTARDLKRKKEALRAFSGVVILGSESEGRYDKKHFDSIKSDRLRSRLTIIGIFCLATFSLTQITSSLTRLTISLYVLSVLGILRGLLLMSAHHGTTYSSLRSFCKISGGDCKKIIASASAEIFGIKLTDLVISYFIFQFLTLTFWGTMETHISLYSLVIPSFVSLAFVGYSIYRMIVMEKAWCPLCLAVDVILLIEFGILLVQIPERPPTHGFLSLASSAFLFGAILSAVGIINETLGRAQIRQKEFIDAIKIAYSPGIFSILLKSQRRVNVMPFKYDLRIGSPKAEIQLVIATNLFCQPCKEEHQKIAHILTEYPDKVSCIFRFANLGPKNEVLSYILQYWLENIYGREDESNRTAEVLEFWFKSMDLKRFKTKYSVQSHELSDERLNEHFSWFTSSAISQTPTFFINGYELPKIYGIETLHSVIKFLSIEDMTMNETILNNQV